jgi:hypothetical protein
MKRIVSLLAASVILATGWYLLSPLLLNRVVDEEVPMEVPSPRWSTEELRSMFDDLSQEDVDALASSEREVLKDAMGELAMLMPPLVFTEPVPDEEEPGRTAPIRGGSFNCGNGECEWPQEDCAYCPEDCGMCPKCGDGACTGDETCFRCSEDCGACPPGYTYEPNVVVRGVFRDADAFHKGSGTAKVFVLENRHALLRLEDFSVTNGPNLHVYLVKGKAGNVENGFLDLGTLKGNKGNQNYEIPDGIDLKPYKSVVIYCVPFRVVFAVASLD